MPPLSLRLGGRLARPAGAAEPLHLRHTAALLWRAHPAFQLALKGGLDWPWPAAGRRRQSGAEAGAGLSWRLSRRLGLAAAYSLHIDLDGAARRPPQHEALAVLQLFPLGWL